ADSGGGRPGAGGRGEVGPLGGGGEGGQQGGGVGQPDELGAGVRRHVVGQPRAVLDRGVEHGGVGAGTGCDVGQGERVDAADPVGVGIAGSDDEGIGTVVLHRTDDRAHDLDALV